MTCHSCAHVRYRLECAILPWTGQPCYRYERAHHPETDPLTDILRLGASAEVAATWMALAAWVATVKRPATPQEAALLRRYHEATGSHARNVEALEALLQEDEE